MSTTAWNVVITLVVVVVVLVALDVLRRRQMDPIGRIGRAIATPMQPPPPAPTTTDSSAQA